MSISSDIFITREEAGQRVKHKLMGEHERIIDLALSKMLNSELTSYLHDECSFYNIVKETKPKKG
jgi:hypothetical protein